MSRIDAVRLLIELASADRQCEQSQSRPHGDPNLARHFRRRYHRKESGDRSFNPCRHYNGKGVLDVDC
jgi:hypothetical protein